MTKPCVGVRRVYDPPQPGEGTRVLVDGIWPRGRTRAQVGADLWLREVAPSRELRNWFGHDPKRWVGFRRRYLAELKRRPEAVERLRALAESGPLTLLYSARDTKHNQAMVLCELICGMPKLPPCDTAETAPET